MLGGMAAPPSYAGFLADPSPSSAALAAGAAHHHQRGTTCGGGLELTAAADDDDDERTGGDRSALLNTHRALSAPVQPWLAAVAAKDDVGSPARVVATRGNSVGRARLPLQLPKWLLKGRGWEGPLPMKWCVSRREAFFFNQSAQCSCVRCWRKVWR